MRGRATRSVGALVAASGLFAVLAVGGCDSTGDPTPTPTPTPSSATTSTSPTPSPSPTPSESSTIPAAARKNTPAGAVAFLRFYFEAVNRAWTEADPQQIKGLGTAKCEFCNRTVDGAKYLKTHEQRYATDPVTVLSIEPFGGASDGEQYLRVSFKQNAVDVVDTDGAVVRSDPLETIDGNAAVRWSSGGWQLRGIEAA